MANVNIKFNGKEFLLSCDNGQEEDSFEGCDYGRILIVDYNLQVTCSGYGYSYAYRPDIVILSGPYGAKACINDQMYDVRI